MVFNWHSPSSTDSDTESVVNDPDRFLSIFPRNGALRAFLSGQNRFRHQEWRDGREEKRKRKLGLNSGQLGRKAVTGPPASRKALAKNPKVKRDALVGSKNKKAAASGSGKDEPPATAKAGEVITPYLKMYTLAELKSTTRNFRLDTMLGEDRFGRVFKGWVDERTLAPSEVGSGIPVAVKKSNLDGDQGLRQWQSEVKLLGKVSHPNLVRLLGYCWEDDHYLLVYEYMKRGSLENHLFRRKAGPLPWDVRLKIAIGAARGLEFLHTPENNVIYRDFKSFNILLDEDYNAKLSDFGLAKQGPVGGDSYVTTRAIEMDGYAAPEYSATSKTEILSAGDFGSVTTMLFRRLRDYLAEHLYVKSNVYRFGVFLLEMLTGLQALDNTRPSGQQNLVEWARPLLHNKRKLRKIMDPRLEGRYPLEAATQAAGLTLKCLEDEPKARPSMDKVLATLEHINTIREKKKETKAGTSSPPFFSPASSQPPLITNSSQSQC